ncbi:MAG: HD domain-containing protein [Thermodesulfobacteriota bacterium]
MNPQLFFDCQRRFLAYVDGFVSEDGNDNRAVLFKKDHTLRVCRNIVMIANKLGMNEPEQTTARVTALFHDIGRFRQYRAYGTFRDAQSVDHAELGLEEIRRHDLLAGICAEKKESITAAIRGHNRLALPDVPDPGFPGLIKLLRDADKLDILRVFARHYEERKVQSDPALELDLPDAPTVSEEVLAAVREKASVKMAWMQTVNDFKLLKLSWVYDLNFEPTCAAIAEHGFIDRIAATLPPDPEIRSVVGKIHSRLLAGSNAGPASPF